MAAKKTPAEAGASHAITLTYDANAVAAVQAEAETELAGLGDFTVDDAEAYAATDAFLTEIVTKKDAIEAMRQQAVGPLNEAKAVIQAWFKPALTALASVEGALKQAMAAWLLRQKAAEAAARANALAAVQSGEGTALVEALTVAADAQAAPKAGRAVASFSWQVARVAEDLLPDEYWVPRTPNMSAILAEARRQGITGEEAPVIPGVIFKRVATVGARR